MPDGPNGNEVGIVDQPPSVATGMATGAGATDRDQRVRMFSSALAEAAQSGGTVRIAFLGIDDAVAARDCRVRVGDLPGARVLADVEVGLRWGDETKGAVYRRKRATERSLKAAGWKTSSIDASRTWDVDPADARLIGVVVDAIESAIAECGAPAWVGWSVSRQEVEPVAAGEPPPDEPWLEDATADDLRERLVRLASLRGGRILVRYTTGESAVIGLTTRRRRGSVVVEAKTIDMLRNRATPSWARWTIAANPSGVQEVFSTLREALAGLSPHGSGGSLSVRLEQRDAAAAWAGLVSPDAILFVFAVYMIIAPIVFVLSWIFGEPETWGAMFILVLGGAAIVMFTMFLLLTYVADARSWRYSVARPLVIAAIVIATSVYVVAVILADALWMAMAALPYLAVLVGLGYWAIRAIRRSKASKT